jgi:hypothetical protein
MKVMSWKVVDVESLRLWEMVETSLSSSLLLLLLLSLIILLSLWSVVWMVGIVEG